MDDQLVLSLFPGIGLLDMAFEEAGFCVVRGPDVLWGGDIKRFHPPAERFEGIIGGPPCQAFSSLRHIVAHMYGPDKVAENLIPEYERCVGEAKPDWFLMENVPAAPAPIVDGYAVHSFKLNNRWVGGEQNRKRVFSFGVLSRSAIDLSHFIQPVALEAFDYSNTICASGQRELEIFSTKERTRAKRLGSPNASYNCVKKSIHYQGLPEDFLDKAPFTVEGKQKVIGNGVPLPMGRAIAQAVVQAIARQS